MYSFNCKITKQGHCLKKRTDIWNPFWVSNSVAAADFPLDCSIFASASCFPKILILQGSARVLLTCHLNFSVMVVLLFISKMTRLVSSQNRIQIQIKRSQWPSVSISYYTSLSSPQSLGRHVDPQILPETPCRLVCIQRKTE